MFTVLKYENADTRFWKPDKTSSELENPLELNSANAVWTESTTGFLSRVNQGHRGTVRDEKNR